jgi:hypothetical protein
MSIKVQRFIVRAKPTPSHPTLQEWQVGRACAFIGDDDRAVAYAYAETLFAQQHLAVLEYENCATLIEDRVAAEGGVVLRAYRAAQAGSPFMLFTPDDPSISKKGGVPPMLPANLDEAFVDRVVARAGGRRLRPDERDFDRNPNADYLLNGYVVEVKDLQSDPIDVPSRQAKAHAVLRSDAHPTATRTLDDIDDPVYVAVILKSVKRRMDHAKKQIRSSRAGLGVAIRGGGIILLNTGLTSIEPNQIFEFADRVVSQSSSIDFVAVITSMVATNGFDTWVVFPFHPEDGGPRPVHVLREAFREEVEVLMSDWAASGFAVPPAPAKPSFPRVFTIDGARYALKNPLPPGSMRGDV